MFVPTAAALGADWVAAIGVRWEESGEETRALLLMLLWRGLAIVRRVFGCFGKCMYGGVKGLVGWGGGGGEEVSWMLTLGDVETMSRWVATCWERGKV